MKIIISSDVPVSYTNDLYNVYNVFQLDDEDAIFKFPSAQVTGSDKQSIFLGKFTCTL